MHRISGQNFDINIGGIMVHVSKMTLDISDGAAVAKTKGLPNGYVDGEVSASGEIEIGVSQRANIVDAARSAGSFQRLPLFDIHAFAKAGDDEFKVEAFDCKLKLSSILDIDSAGGSELMIKLPFEVTGKDFISIDGVPYLDPEVTKAFA